MSTVKLQKISRQHERTWTELHQRLMSMEFDYDAMFSPSVSEFIKKMSQSVSSCEGYFIPSLITTTSFVAGMNSVVMYKGQTMPLNTFSVLVGPPTTGK